MDKLFSILVLDYERVTELTLLLNSLKENVKVDKDKFNIIVLANGGSLDYHSQCYELYNKELIDDLIIRRENAGGGFGQIDLFNYCSEDFVFFVQSDQILVQEINEELVQYFKGLLENFECIDLAGQQCRDETGLPIYSERAQFINRKFYNSIENKPGGCAGPFAHLEWNEGYVQNKFRENDWKIAHINPIIFSNNGKVSERINPDGSRWKHFTDTKELFLISGPIKEKYVYPNLTDSEWDDCIKEQRWEDGQIPDKEINQSFKYWN